MTIAGMWSDWKVFERGGVIFSTLEPHMEGFFGAPKKGKEYYAVRRALIGWKGQHLYWCYGQPEYRQDAVQWINRWAKEGVKGNFVRTAQTRYKMCMKFLSPLLEEPLPKTNKGLLTYFDEANKYLLLHSRTMAISIDAFDDYFAEVVAGVLKDAGYGKVCEDKEAWSKLLQPAYRSVIMDYKLALIKGLSANRIWKKYFWLTMGWSGTAPLGERGIYEEMLKHMGRSSSALRKEQHVLLAYAKDIVKQRASVIKHYRIPSSLIQPYLRILDIFARLHDERKEIQMRTLYVMDQVRRAVARRFRMSLKDVQMLKVSELRELLRTGKFPYARIRARRIGYYRRFENGRMVREIEGKAAHAFIDKELVILKSTHAEVKGTIASRGRAIGRAVVTDDPKEALHIIKQGNILITSMTTPDFVPAMKKAGGVVTNEGGVTVHAAIVSREFGIPCITGTIHATHVFKTGDKVEIDAEKGIVKKL